GGRFARPALSRQGVHPHRRHRFRQGDALLRELHVLVRDSQMALAQRSASNKKKSEQIDDLKAFIARFSANASKSRQASSRKKLLDKITLDDIRPSNRKYPFIQFKAERALGKDVVTVEGLRKT